MSASVEFVSTRVLAAEPAGEAQVRLEVAAPPGFLDAHVRPGQYCELRVPGGEAAPYALANTPDERALVFIVKAGGDPGADIARLRVGEAVEVAVPSGPGFELGRAEGLDVAFVATGTGIAPIRAALDAVLARREVFGALSLYYGVRDDRFIALAHDLQRWRDAGVRVRVHHSRRGGVRESGYVQDMIEDDAPDPRLTYFVVAGHVELVAALVRYVTARGVGRERVIENL